MINVFVVGLDAFVFVCEAFSYFSHRIFIFVSSRTVRFGCVCCCCSWILRKFSTAKRNVGITTKHVPIYLHTKSIFRIFIALNACIFNKVFFVEKLVECAVFVLFYIVIRFVHIELNWTTSGMAEKKHFHKNQNQIVEWFF